MKFVIEQEDFYEMFSDFLMKKGYIKNKPKSIMYLPKIKRSGWLGDVYHLVGFEVECVNDEN